MRTLVIIAGGMLLLALCVVGARMLFATDKQAVAKAVWVFIGLWFLVAGGNMVIGVTQAGYGVKEELPIFLLIFGLPAALALAVKWKLG